MKITHHPAAEQDLLEAATFYEREGSPALAASAGGLLGEVTGGWPFLDADLPWILEVGRGSCR